MSFFTVQKLKNLFTGQLKEKNREILQKDLDLFETQKSALEAQKAAFDSQEGLILHQMKDAKQRGDAESEILLNRDLASVIANKTKIEEALDSVVNNLNGISQIDQEESIEAPDFALTQDRNRSYQNWLARNKWADENSDEYNQDLAEFATVVESSVNNRYKLNKDKRHLIGTDEYLKEVEEELYKNLDSVQNKEDKENDRSDRHDGDSINDEMDVHDPLPEEEEVVIPAVSPVKNQARTYASQRHLDEDAVNAHNLSAEDWEMFNIQHPTGYTNDELRRYADSVSDFKKKYKNGVPSRITISRFGGV